MERRVLYALQPQDAPGAFGAWAQRRDAPALAEIERASLAVHWWNMLTKNVPLVCGSLMHTLMSRNCLRCRISVVCEQPATFRGGHVDSLPGSYWFTPLPPRQTRWNADRYLEEDDYDDDDVDGQVEDVWQTLRTQAGKGVSVATPL